MYILLLKILILLIHYSGLKMMLYLSLVDFVIFQFFLLLSLFTVVTIYIMLIHEIIFTVLGLRFRMGRPERRSEGNDD